MEPKNSESLTSIIFEHACKKDFKKTVDHVLKNEESVSQVISELSSKESSKIKPLFMFIFLLKKLDRIEGCLAESSQVLPIFINLLETTFKQLNFISHKKYFKFLSELKLLDLLNLIAKCTDSKVVLEKLNKYFPRWSSLYQKTIEKDYCLDNSKLLKKVEESNAQCRRLILRLAVDVPYRSNYMSEEYSSDSEKILKEIKCCIKEAIKTLENSAGYSTLEKMIENEEGVSDNKNLSMHLLFEYIQPNITDEALVRFLDDLTLDSQPATCLSSCLLPFDSSEEEDSDMSESEYESSHGGSQLSRKSSEELNGY